MPNYNWQDYAKQPVESRFPDWAAGKNAWSARPLDRALGPDGLAAEVRPSRPRVFISHRQADAVRAARVAELVAAAGWEYWLDIVDPQLTNWWGSSLSTADHALAVAASVEIALLNSTHLLALWSPNSHGSNWIPYEYGRAKAEYVLFSSQCAARVDIGTDIPEFMRLGVVHHTDQDVARWLAEEKSRLPTTVGRGITHR